MSTTAAHAAALLRVPVQNRFADIDRAVAVRQRTVNPRARPPAPISESDLTEAAKVLRRHAFRPEATAPRPDGPGALLDEYL